MTPLRLMSGVRPMASPGDGTHIHNDNMLIRTGEFFKGSWTAADASHPIGRTNYEFDPDSISTTSDSVKGKVNTQLTPFVAQITDVYGNPIADTRVRFGITEVPSSASGQILSDTLAMTDSQGRVSTQLTLGNRSGRYVVSAQVESVPSTQIAFYGYASSGINSLRPESAPAPDSIKQVVGPFIVEALDEANVSVPYTGVHFSVTPPFGSGATKHMFT